MHAKGALTRALEHLRIRRLIPHTLDPGENPPPLLQLSEEAGLACAGMVLDSQFGHLK